MYNDSWRYSLKKIIAILAFLLLMQIFANPSFASKSRYNVYTPQSYKQVNIVQSPKYSRIYGEGIELLVDYSGSMAPWIKLTKDSLKYILPKIPDTASVALRVFGERITSIFYSYSDACKATRLVSFFKSANQTTILKGLDEAKLGGMTPLEFALKEAIEKDFKNMTVVSRGNPTGKRKKIILITDGSDTCNGDPCAYIQQAIRKHKDLQIDVIQLGADVSLMCLTNETEGEFFKVEGNEAKFEKALEKSFKVPIGTIETGRNNDPEVLRQRAREEKRKQEELEMQLQQQKPTRGYKFIKY